MARTVLTMPADWPSMTLITALAMLVLGFAAIVSVAFHVAPFG